MAVGLGSPANARRFAEILGFPLEMLYADPSGSCYSALGFRCASRAHVLGLGIEVPGFPL